MKTLKKRHRTISSSFFQEILGDREAGGITYYGVGMAEGTLAVGGSSGM